LGPGSGFGKMAPKTGSWRVRKDPRPDSYTLVPGRWKGRRYGFSKVKRNPGRLRKFAGAGDRGVTDQSTSRTERARLAEKRGFVQFALSWRF